MGRMARNKGYRGEREVIAILQPVVTKVCGECSTVELILKRNLHQRFAAKQYDLEGIPWMALEVKRVENQSGIGSWWRQCCAATRPGQTSVLFYRQNNAPWRVRFRTWVRVGGKGSPHVKATVTTDLPAFLVWFENRLRWEMQNRR